ncbi:hypothetical protein C8R47DRAFT_1091483 [Mycena vitilis]|nr:hypothetical protein C8R47DRAFT_1091483 [Mycena vitilis]
MLKFSAMGLFAAQFILKSLAGVEACHQFQKDLKPFGFRSTRSHVWFHIHVCPHKPPQTCTVQYIQELDNPVTGRAAVNAVPSLSRRRLDTVFTPPRSSIRSFTPHVAGIRPLTLLIRLYYTMKTGSRPFKENHQRCCSSCYTTRTVAPCNAWNCSSRVVSLVTLRSISMRGQSLFNKK